MSTKCHVYLYLLFIAYLMQNILVLNFEQYIIYNTYIYLHINIQYTYIQYIIYMNVVYCIMYI